MSYANKATKRVEDYLTAHFGGEASPAEVIADVIHYCKANNIDFDAQVVRAQGYYEAELEADDIESNG